jgi:LacI family transcriptional regulator
MADVAKLAGVSVSTVSHVINGTRFVKPATRELVLDAIDRTGYTHNTIARALVMASTNTLGLAVAVGGNPYFGDLVRAIHSEAARHGHTLLLGDTREDADEELQTVRDLCGRRVDGIIVAPTADPDHRALKYALDQSMPLVLIDRLVSPDYDQVTVANVEPVAALVEHLAEIGHRRIGMVAGLDGLSTTHERVDGYQLGLARSGLRSDPRLVVDGRSTLAPARTATRRLLNRADPPTALVVGNNLMTIGAMHALRDLGLRAPEDVALASYDDFEWADLVAPRLTTVAQPAHDLGVQAVRLLLRRIAEPDAPPRTVRLKPTLMHRDSCGCGGKLPLTPAAAKALPASSP